MKASAPAHDLGIAFAEAQRFIDKKSSSPTIGNVLLVAEGDTIKLTGTNLAMGLSSSIEAKVREEGAIVVPGKITDILRTCDGNATLSLNKSMLSVTVDGFRGKFQGLNPNDYPPLPDPEKVIGRIKLKAELLERVLSLTSSAVERDETLLSSNIALRFKKKDKVLTVASTDGVRFSIASINVPYMSLEDDMEILIPGESMASLRQPLKGVGDEDISLGVTADGKILVFGAGIFWFANNVDGSFPNIFSVIPQDDPICELMAKTDALKQACKRMLVVNEINMAKGGGTVQINLNPDSGKLTMESSVEETGSGKMVVKPTFGAKSAEVNLYINLKYFQETVEALEGLGASVCKIDITENNKQPIMISGVIEGIPNCVGIMRSLGPNQKQNKGES